MQIENQIQLNQTNDRVSIQSGLDLFGSKNVKSKYLFPHFLNELNRTDYTPTLYFDFFFSILINKL